MRKKVFRQIDCIRCGVTFSPLSGRTLYCDRCRPLATKERSHQSKKKRKSQTEPSRSPAPWSEIIRICEQNRCTYGQAVAKGLLG